MKKSLEIRTLDGKNVIDFLIFSYYNGIQSPFGENEIRQYEGLYVIWNKRLRALCLICTM